MICNRSVISLTLMDLFWSKNQKEKWKKFSSEIKAMSRFLLILGNMKMWRSNFLSNGKDIFMNKMHKVHNSNVNGSLCKLSHGFLGLKIFSVSLFLLFSFLVSIHWNKVTLNFYTKNVNRKICMSFGNHQIYADW